MPQSDVSSGLGGAESPDSADGPGDLPNPYDLEASKRFWEEQKKFWSQPFTILDESTGSTGPSGGAPPGEANDQPAPGAKPPRRRSTRKKTPPETPE